MIDNKRLSVFVVQCIAEFGCESQTDILQEECAELIQACSKAKRGYPDSKERLIENAAVRWKKMNKEERSTMPGIVAVTKYLVGIWHESKCPSNLLPDDCSACKYRYLCSKLDELSMVIDSDYL